MTTATMTIGDFQIIKLGDFYELTEAGDLYGEYRTLEEARRVAQQSINGHLAQEIRDATFFVDGFNDSICGDRKTWKRVCRLGDSGKPEAEAELREILAKVKAALAA